MSVVATWASLLAKPWVDLLNTAPATQTFDYQALLVGEPLTLAKLNQALANLASAGDELLRLTSTRAIFLPAPVPDWVKNLAKKRTLPDQPTEERWKELEKDLATLAIDARAVAEAVRQGGRCEPLLPECCVSCERAVRIATITVTECKVTDVC